MPDITASQEVLPRYQVDEYGTVNFQLVTVTTLPDGTTSESYWRVVVTPDDDLNDVKLQGLDPVPQAMRDAVAAARYPATVARFEARKAEEALNPVVEDIP